MMALYNAGNIDGYDNGDSADWLKSWDLFPPPGQSMAEFLYREFGPDLTMLANHRSSQRNVPPDAEAVLAPYRIKKTQPGTGGQ